MQWHGVLDKVVIPMVLSPIAGLIVGYLVMTAILWIFRRSNPGRVSRGFRYAQSFSACAMAFGHGLQDAAKTAGVVVLALNVGGYHTGDAIPLWVLRADRPGHHRLGTYAGGWRIMRTLGRRIIHLDPPHGFAAETTAASILYVAGLVFGAPISTTHTITSAIMGVGATKRLRGRALGRGRQHRRRLDPDLPRRRPPSPPSPTASSASSPDPARLRARRLLLCSPNADFAARVAPENGIRRVRRGRSSQRSRAKLAGEAGRVASCLRGPDPAGHFGQAVQDLRGGPACDLQPE